MSFLQPRINIVLSDRNWILERLGLELHKRLSNVVISDSADPSARINYYITFACRKTPSPTLEAAFFTHKEQDPQLQRLFFNTARGVDLPIAQSDLYRDMLRSEGVENAITISPGVDHDKFRPGLRIGVVGRTYHTGRKGEGLLAQLTDMEGIEWHFTGSGWPGPGQHLHEDDLPAFYRSMDYILVPALYEGGPMCVLEALAVGTPVIASNVGWVPQFPHIPFRNGDASDLRRVLTELLAAKQALCESTRAYTWDNFAAAHDRAFRDLVTSTGDTRPGLISIPQPPFAGPVRLLLHGNEAATLGGPSIRVPQTAEALRSLGVAAEVSDFVPDMDIPETIVHLFNVWPPATALQALRHLKRLNKIIVFSPIYLDLSNWAFWNDQLPDLQPDDAQALARAMQRAATHLKGRGRLSEVVPGYNAMIRDMIAMADHVVFLSEREREALADIGAVVDDARASLILNAVEVDRWQDGDPALFQTRFLAGRPGPEDYVICVGRIEERKNQLMLAHAMKDLPLRLVLIGHEGNPSYARKLRDLEADHVMMVGRVPPASDMLRSALTGAKAFVLPSWSEGASLAALEAAAAGIPLVLSDLSSEREYFGTLAHYCNPGDPDSMRAAIKAALMQPDPEAHKVALRALMRERNSWSHIAWQTAQSYARAEAGAKAAPTNEAAGQVRPDLVIDITSLCNSEGDMARFVAALAHEITALEQTVSFIFWSERHEQFIDMPAAFAKPKQAIKYRELLEQQRLAPAISILPPSSTLFVAGETWQGSDGYLRGLEQLKWRSGCGLISVIHDFGPLHFPFWFRDIDTTALRQAFQRLTAISDHLLTVSESDAVEIRTALATVDQRPIGLSVIREGDHLPVGTQEMPGMFARQFTGIPFVLAVGKLDARTNHELLCRIWARFAQERRHDDLHLILIGDTACDKSGLTADIAADMRIKARVHVIWRPADSDMAWLYENCLFTLHPSRHESWGRQITASLAAGKLCLASSAVPMPDAALELVERIDPEDFMKWQQKISFYATSRASRTAREAAIRARYSAASWTDTAKQILDIVAQPHRRTPLLAPYPGQALAGGALAAPLSLGFCENWHPPEEWGRWSASNTCCVTVNTSMITTARTRGLLVLLRHRAHVPKGSARDYTVSVAGKKLYHQKVLSPACFPANLLLAVGHDAIDADGNLRIAFDFPVAPASGSAPASGHSLGLGLSGVVLLDRSWSNPLQSLDNPELWFEGTGRATIDMFLARHRAVIAPDLVFDPSWGVGSGTASFSVPIPLLPGAPAQTLSIGFRPIATQVSPVAITFLLNGTVLANSTHVTDDVQRLDLGIPAKFFRDAAPAVLTCAWDSLMTPAELGLGTTVLLTGVGLHDLELVPAESCR